MHQLFVALNDSLYTTYPTIFYKIKEKNIHSEEWKLSFALNLRLILS